MSNIQTPAAQRLRETIAYANLSPSAFAKWIGFSQPGIVAVLQGRNKGISAELGEKITVAMPSLNPEWLLWGRGEMLRSDNGKKKYAIVSESDIGVSEAETPYGYKDLERRVSALEVSFERLRRLVEMHGS